METLPLLVKSLNMTYRSESNRVTAIEDVDLALEHGEFVSVFGRSGSGKTTLLNMMGGLLRPTSGEVVVNGTSLFDLDDGQLTVFRRKHIGFVFQNLNLVPILSVRDNIVLPILLDGQDVDSGFFDEVISTLGIGDKLSEYPAQLSGGQQQRVAIARSLITKPAIVLADEPTGNLDSKTGSDVMGLFRESAAKYHQTVVLVTHNESLAHWTDRSITLADGKVL